MILAAVMMLALAAAVMMLGVPRIKRALSWRLDIAYTYVSQMLSPSGKLPTPVVSNLPGVQVVTPTAQPLGEEDESGITPTPRFTPTPTRIPTPIPDRVQLTPPAYDEVRDKQDVNNCGPATLALYLRYYGWEGDQFTISKLIKPTSDDRNVNVEELVFYVRNHAGWLSAEFRVGGTVERLKALLAAGFPVMIEETFTTDRQYWPQDDRWSGHYLLVTGYDDSSQTFTVHDSEDGPNQRIQYDVLDEHWQSFNRVYIVVYRPETEETLKEILGEDWDVDTNRQNALAMAEEETRDDPQNAFAWFNLGSNLVYFSRYAEAAEAYNTARTIGLPQRMLRYQFGPFMAYFHSLQTEELMALTRFALDITRTSEEAMLWRGWGLYRMGDKTAALSFFRDALRIRPDYDDAISAIEYVTAN